MRCAFFVLCSIPALSGLVADGKGVSAQERTIRPGDNWGVNSIAFSPDGKSFVTAHGARSSSIFGSQGHVVIWETKSGNKIAKTRNLGPVYKVTLSPDGKTIAAGALPIVLLDFASQKTVRTLPTHNYVSDLTFSPDGKYLVSCHWADRLLYVWDSQTGKVLETLDVMSLRPHSKDPEKGKQPKKSRTEDDLIEHVCFSPDGKKLAVSSWNYHKWEDKVVIWEVDNWTKARILTQGPRPDTGTLIRFAPKDSELLFVSGSIWNVKKGKKEIVLDGYSILSRDVSFSFDERFVCTAGDSLTVWDLKANKQIAHIPSTNPWKSEGIKAASFSPVENTAVYGDRVEGWLGGEKAVIKVIANVSR